MRALENGKKCNRFESKLSAVNNVLVTGDGKYVISGSEDKTVRIWNLTSGKCLWIVGGYHWENNAAVRSMAITPGGRYIVSAGLDIVIWKFGKLTLKLPDLIRFILWGLTRSGPARIFTIDGYMYANVLLIINGNYIAYSSDRIGEVNLIKRNNGKCVWVLESMNTKNTVLSHTDGTLIAAGCENGTIHLWDLKLIV
ncbi:MAG: hypothetical protein JW881_08535 [Spirochaetales bacterium]|nr:hypothetical protein [Spirochaetales bacterium]